MAATIVFFNGNLLSDFDLSNRAFEYGDGIFESLIAYKQSIQFWQSHYQRLWEACQVLRLELPSYFSASFLEDVVLNLAQKNHLNDFFRIKINVWRRAGGLYSPTQNQAEYLLRVYPYQPHQEKVKHRAIFFREIPLVYSTISPFKTLNSLPYVLAGIAAQEQNAQDAILLSSKGYIAEAIASNIFWIKENQVFTPSLFCGGKRGVMQEKIFEKIKNLGISLKIGEFRPEDLLQAQVVFMSNVAGIVALRSIEDKVFQTEHEFLDIFRELQIK